MFTPKGIYAAMLTPFHNDGSINEKVTRDMVEFMILKGLHGIFPVSTSGEFPHMTFEQSVEMMKIVVDQAKGRVKITPGVSSTCADNSIALAKEAKRLNCEAIVICPPYYYDISQNNIQKHVETIAAAVDIPIVLYNIPFFTMPMEQDTIVSLSRNKQIVSIKDSSGSMVNMLHCMDRIRDINPNMSFLTGKEDMLLPLLMMGGHGCMTACANIFPEIMVGIWNAYHAGDIAKAKRLQFLLLPLIRLMFQMPFPVGFKTGLELRGFDMGPHRQPICETDEKKLVEIKTELATLFAKTENIIKNEKLV